MPRYRVSGPDGATYDVTAPEGASQEQIIAYARRAVRDDTDITTPRETPSQGPIGDLADEMRAHDVGYHRATLVPMRTEAKTGKRELAWPELLRAPVQSAVNLMSYLEGSDDLHLEDVTNVAAVSPARSVGGAFGRAYPTRVVPQRESYVGNAVRRATMPLRGSADAADEALAGTVKRARTTPQQVIDDMRRGQSAARFGNSVAPLRENLADLLGDAGQRQLRAVVAVPGRGSAVARHALESRQKGTGNPFAVKQSGEMGQRERLLDQYARAMKIKTADSAYNTGKSVAAEQKRLSAPAYKKAWETSEDFDLSVPISRMMEEMAYLEGGRLNVARRAINMFYDKSGKNLRPLGRADELRRFDSAKRGLDDMIKTLRQSGRNEMAALIDRFRSELLDAVHGGSTTSPTRNVAYSNARGLYAGSARMREAIDFGRTSLREGGEATAEQFRELSPGEQQMFRIGQFEDVRKTLGRQAPGHDAAKMFNVPNNQDLLREVFPRAKSRKAKVKPSEQFGELVARERRGNETRNFALSGSRTTPLAEDVADLTGWARVMQRLRSAGVMQTVVDTVTDELVNRFAYREAVAYRLARMLTNTNPRYVEAIMQRIESRMTPKQRVELRGMLPAVMARIAAAEAVVEEPRR